MNCQACNDSGTCWSDASFDAGVPLGDDDLVQLPHLRRQPADGCAAQRHLLDEAGDQGVVRP